MPPSRELLDGAGLGERLPGGWSVDGNHLRKTFQFADFVEAFAFMQRCAFEAEKLNHHPNWSNVYRTVEVELWTHDAGGITAFDLELAAAMNRHAGEE